MSATTAQYDVTIPDGYPQPQVFFKHRLGVIGFDCSDPAARTRRLELTRDEAEEFRQLRGFHVVPVAAPIAHAAKAGKTKEG